MCFSATASFTASAVLVGGGIAVIRYFGFSKKEMCFAVIPLIFGLHQFSEGVVWLGINGVVPAEIQTAAMYFFGFIAFCFWPAFIPLSLLCYEHPKNHKLYSVFLICGTALGIYLLWCFTSYSNLNLNVKCCSSLAYTYYVPWGHNYLDGLYVFLVVVPMLLSSNLRIRYLLGPGFFLTFLIALAIQSGQDYPSIWCFLAAILSIINYYALVQGRQKNEIPETIDNKLGD